MESFDEPQSLAQSARAATSGPSSFTIGSGGPAL